MGTMNLNSICRVRTYSNESAQDLELALPFSVWNYYAQQRETNGLSSGCNIHSNKFVWLLSDSNDKVSPSRLLDSKLFQKFIQVPLRLSFLCDIRHQYICFYFYTNLRLKQASSCFLWCLIAAVHQLPNYPQRQCTHPTQSNQKKQMPEIPKLCETSALEVKH